MDALSFEVVTDFESAETQSHYVGGLRYIARPQDARLRALVPIWEREGRIVVLARAQDAAHVGGTGLIA